MSIYCYTGTPGTGKSLHAASEIRFRLNRRDRPCLGNFELARDAPVRHPENYHYWPNDMIHPDMLTEWATEYWTNGTKRPFREDSLLLVLDECQLLFNARTWNASDRLAWLEFFSQHRKYGYQVVLVAQSDKMVDNQFRMLIEYEIQHRKVANMGILGSLLSDVTIGRLFMCVTYYYPIAQRLGSRWYLARGKDMKMYETRKTFQRGDATA